jgi:hypothetical protein
MKNLKLKPLNLLYNILVFALLFAFVGINVAFALPCGVATGFLLGFVKTPQVAIYMAIQKQIWENHIEEGLYKDNPFLKTMRPADKENINGTTVTIPQAGAAAAVVKNRTTLPAVVTQRTDIPTTYQIGEFTSDPMLVKHADTVELSYDKRESVLRDNTNKLAEEVAEDVLMSVVNPGTGTTTQIPAGSILLTAGADGDPTAPSATGTRKKYQVTDLQRAQTFLIRKKAWKNGRMFALLTAEAAAQMFPADSIVAATAMSSCTEEERRNGIMYKAYGFSIATRATVYVFNNAGAFKPQSASGAATDDEGILFYNGDAVEFAMGDVVAFENEKDATFYGDVFSFLVRCGARAMREAFDGLLILKQAKGA